jgi:two-component system, sensor histidine kinase PdtaS
MTIEYSPASAGSPPRVIFESHERVTLTSYKRELIRHKRTETGLRLALAREEALLFQKDKLIKQQTVLSQEADHRLLNGLQMIVSLLSLQSRASTNAEVTAQLAAVADRIATIGRIHHRLHSFDGVQTFALKQYLEDLCRDFSMMLLTTTPTRIIVVEGIEITLPSVTAVPLGFIANELITNAAKYGVGRITVRLEANAEKSYALSVSNDGPSLPEGFDPTDHKGLGMRIIQSLVKQIGGELRIGRGDRKQGTRFTVLFSCLHNEQVPHDEKSDRRPAIQPLLECLGTEANRPSQVRLVMLIVMGSSSKSPAQTGVIS